MNKKILGIVVCTLLMAATVLPVAGTINTAREKGTTDAAGIQDDVMRPSGNKKIPVDVPLQNCMSAYGYAPSGNYPAPEYAFIKEPTPVMFSYYDYMPGSYSTHPVRLQAEHGSGIYFTFFGSDTSNYGVNRDQYYAYVNASREIQTVGKITSYDNRQGYGSIDIHPATGDPIASWHEDLNDDPNDPTGAEPLETSLTYDDYDASETPGHWQSPLGIDNVNPDYYIWPYVYVGPSPDEGKVRVYQVANNALQNSLAHPCEDVRIMYTDVINENGVNISSLLSLGQWQTVYVFTPWRAKDCRPFQSFAIDYNHPGRVAFIGDAEWLSGDLGSMPVDEGLFVWESTDYGATWDPYTGLYVDGAGSPIYQVDNPGFEGAPALLDVSIYGYHNTALYDAEGNLHWTFMQSYGYSDAEGSYYFPYFLPQAEVVWNSSSQTFTFHEVPELAGVDAHSGHSVPWLDSEHLYPTMTWSEAGSDDLSFHENTQKQAINVDNNWMVQMWDDGTKTRLGIDGDPAYAEYTEHPVVFLSVSPDNGNTWSEPIELTDIHSEQFDFSDQITVYPYFCDKIIDLGDNWGQVDIYYFDDKDFLSSVNAGGDNTGGNITYCSIKIKFPEPGALYANAHGDYTGYVGEDIQFIGSAIGGVEPYTWNWTFGDSGTSDQQNPTHKYTTVGTYTAKLTVTDDVGAHATDNATVAITGQPKLAIGVLKGGLMQVSAEFINNGSADTTGVTWTITVTGNGIFRRINVSANGTNVTIGAGDTVVGVARPIYGFAKLDIMVNATAPGLDPVGKKATAFVFIVFVIGVKEV